MKYAAYNNDFSKKLIPCELAHLVVGATLYLSDPRKTPVTVSGCCPHTASFTLTVDDFEDRGGEWNLPLWDISKFLATPGSAKLTQPEQRALSKNIEAMNRRFQIPVDESVLKKSQSEITKLQSEIEDWLHLNCAVLPDHPEILLDSNMPNDAWSVALEQMMESRGLLQMDCDFATQFGSIRNSVYGGQPMLLKRVIC